MGTLRKFLLLPNYGLRPWDLLALVFGRITYITSPWLSFGTIYIPLGNLIVFYLDDVHLFKESYRLFSFWTMCIHLRNLIVFYLDNVHPFKDFYRLFCFWTMYIHLRNLIVFHLDDIHPFKKSYRLLFGRYTSI